MSAHTCRRVRLSRDLKSSNIPEPSKDGILPSSRAQSKKHEQATRQNESPKFGLLMVLGFLPSLGRRATQGHVVMAGSLLQNGKVATKMGSHIKIAKAGARSECCPSSSSRTDLQAHYTPAPLCDTHTRTPVHVHLGTARTVEVELSICQPY